MNDLIYRQDAEQAKMEFLNTKVTKETEEQTIHDRAYAEGWNDCNSAYIKAIMELPSAEPEPAIPLSWIEGQIKWLKSLDNAFSTLTAVQISAMVNKWRGEQDE